MDAVCTSHPERPAVALCAGCEKSFCQDCLVEEQGVYYCNDPFCRKQYLKAVQNRLKFSSFKGDIFEREKAIRFVRGHGTFFLIFSIINFFVSLDYSPSMDFRLPVSASFGVLQDNTLFFGEVMRWFAFLETFMSIDKYFSIAGIVSGIGLLLLKNWGRYLFLLVLAGGVLYFSVAFFVGYRILNTIKALPEQYINIVLPGSFISVMSSVAIVVYAISVLYFLYLLKRLNTQEIREVFN